uniref:Uncharacterized protein LOC116949627 n=1 Tax=Petromyzon marinus TaxID=7757 RepID=A0AAJ7TS25_PETMA|nr:uncharacterized protein LOC116949627 [Petromyzon marinus]
MSSFRGKPKSSPGSGGTRHPKQGSTGEHRRSGQHDQKQGEGPRYSGPHNQQHKGKQEGQKAEAGQPGYKQGGGGGSTENQTARPHHSRQGATAACQNPRPRDPKQGGIPELNKLNLDFLRSEKTDSAYYRQGGSLEKHKSGPHHHRQGETTDHQNTCQKDQRPKGTADHQQSRPHHKSEGVGEHQKPSIIQHQQRPNTYIRKPRIATFQHNQGITQPVQFITHKTPIVNNTQYWLNLKPPTCTVEDKTADVLANVNKQVPVVDIGRVNQTAQDCLTVLADTDQHVSKDVVSALLCKCLKVPSVTTMGLKSEYDIPAIAEFMKTHKAVHTFIKAYKSIRCISTLHELGRDAAALQKKGDFRELGLGPLCRHPAVAAQYGQPSSMKDDDIPKITTADVLKNLQSYLLINQGQRVDQAEFMMHLKDKYRLNSVQELGVSISSLGLAISTIFKVQRCDTEAREQARAQLEHDVLRDLEAKLQRQKQSLLNLFDDGDGGARLKQQYASQSAAELLYVVFKNADQIFSNKIKRTVQDFLSLAAGDPLAKTLFQIAVCGGSLATPSQPGLSEMSSNSCKLKADDIQPTLAESVVRDEMLELLGGTGAAASLSLGDLAETEKQLAERFNVPDFPSLGHGSFLEFLNGNSKVLGKAGVSTLSLDTSEAHDVGFSSSGKQLIDFDALCVNLNITEDQDKEPQQQDEPFKDPSSQSPIFPGMTRSDGSRDVQKSQAGVGVQGNVGADRALQCLLTAPLLEDLAAWSHWELLFEQKHGPLKEFIENVCSGKVAKLGESTAAKAVLAEVSELLALELQPGLLLRIAAEPSPEKFAEAALHRDPVVSVAQLVSLVAAQGLSEAPLALLANRIEVVLTIMAEEKVDLYTAGGMQGGAITAAHFVLDCLCQIPLQLCKDLAPQVFLAPFEHTVGEADWQDVLLRAASMPDWQSGTRRARLQELGQLLDIEEWTCNFEGGLEDQEITDNSEEDSGSMESASGAEEESEFELCKLKESTP